MPTPRTLKTLILQSSQLDETEIDLFRCLSPFSFLNSHPICAVCKVRRSACVVYEAIEASVSEAREPC